MKMSLSRPSSARYERSRRRARAILRAFGNGVRGIAYSMLLPGALIAALLALLGVTMLFLRFLR